MNNEYIIPKEYKNKDTITISDTTITLPHYIKNSISKYKFVTTDNVIYLQRKCNKCNSFFTVQTITDNTYINVDNIPFKYLGKKSGFYHICNKCTMDSANNTLLISQHANGSSMPNGTSNINDAVIPTEVITTVDPKEHINITIVKDLKHFYKILAIKNSSTLSIEVSNALNFYKDYLDKSSKN